MPDKPSADKKLALRTTTMPADTNPSGDIFGGWILARMDMAGSSTAVKKAGGRVATVAIDSMEFLRPVFVGDEISCYTEIMKIGKTSITIRVETWRRARDQEDMEKVTAGIFIYVAIDRDRTPRVI